MMILLSLVAVLGLIGLVIGTVSLLSLRREEVAVMKHTHHRSPSTGQHSTVAQPNIAL
jgi:hypothetical protein